jgi:hypothetical protein
MDQDVTVWNRMIHAVVHPVGIAHEDKGEALRGHWEIYSGMLRLFSKKRFFIELANRCTFSKVI